MNALIFCSRKKKNRTESNTIRAKQRHDKLTDVIVSQKNRFRSNTRTHVFLTLTSTGHRLNANQNPPKINLISFLISFLFLLFHVINNPQLHSQLHFMLQAIYRLKPIQICPFSAWSIQHRQKLKTYKNTAKKLS